MEKQLCACYYLPAMVLAVSEITLRCSLAAYGGIQPNRSDQSQSVLVCLWISANSAVPNTASVAAKTPTHPQHMAQAESAIDLLILAVMRQAYFKRFAVLSHNQ